MNRAAEQLNRVALVLLAAARRRGSFLVEPDELSIELERLKTSFNDTLFSITGAASGYPPTATYVVEVSPKAHDRLELKCQRGSEAYDVSLRIDGVLEDETVGFGFIRDDHAQSTFTPEDERVLKQAISKRPKGERPSPSFRPADFIRTLAVDPQIESRIQILAVELYLGGLVVHFQYNDPVDLSPALPLSVYAQAGVKPPIDRLLTAAEAAGGTLAPSVSVADDLGSSYHCLGGENAGMRVVHGAERFAPGIPDRATHVRIATYAGEVRLSLDTSD